MSRAWIKLVSVPEGEYEHDILMQYDDESRFAEEMEHRRKTWQKREGRKLMVFRNE